MKNSKNRSIHDLIINSSYVNGFTLIELVLVLTLLSLLAVMGSRFMVSATDSYHTANHRARLLNQGRLVTEKISRILRNSLPNSLRISATGRCIEFFPIVGGSHYETDIAISGDSNTTSTINTAPFDLGLGNPVYAVVAARDSNELYVSLTTPSSISAVDSVASTAITSIPLSIPHQFLRQSLNDRVYIIDNPNRICVNGSDEVRHHSNYGLLSSGINDTPPNAGIVLASDVVLAGETPFTLSAASVNRNAIVAMEIPFERNGERLVIEHRVYIRNVP